MLYGAQTTNGLKPVQRCLPIELKEWASQTNTTLGHIYNLCSDTRFIHKPRPFTCNI